MTKPSIDSPHGGKTLTLCRYDVSNEGGNDPSDHASAKPRLQLRPIRRRGYDPARFLSS